MFSSDEKLFEEMRLGSERALQRRREKHLMTIKEGTTEVEKDGRVGKIRTGEAAVAQAQLAGIEEAIDEVKSMQFTDIKAETL